MWICKYAVERNIIVMKIHMESSHPNKMTASVYNKMFYYSLLKKLFDDNGKS